MRRPGCRCRVNPDPLVPGVEALRSRLRLHGSHTSALLQVAQQLPRAERPLRQALEYLG